jgi:NAD(P)-dependent dehydrogenase (short-subunit alcohol dehydrogenase family)
MYFELLFLGLATAANSLTMTQGYAYITGAASGIGLEIARVLSNNSIKVFLADLDDENIRAAAAELKAPFAVVDVANWESQMRGFKTAVSHFGRLDYVFPVAGIGENSWLPPMVPDEALDVFDKPNLSVIDVNVTGLFYTVSMAVQLYRKQQPNHHGFRGKSKHVPSSALHT